MPFGPGKYGEALTLARQACGASAALLIVFDGESGGGFSVQAPPGFLIDIPATLRKVADGVEADLKQRGMIE